MGVLSVVLSTDTKGKNNVETAIVAWVAERVDESKQLRGGIHIIEAIPKNLSGKILCRLLRDQAGAAVMP
jgi:acyl-coenzyme A synthetase/AMP-(fatty) acid ligase